MLVKGSSEAKLSVVQTNKALYGKARSRRGEAYRNVGNLSQSQLDLERAFKILGDAVNKEDIQALARSRTSGMHGHASEHAAMN